MGWGGEEAQFCPRSGKGVFFCGVGVGGVGAHARTHAHKPQNIHRHTQAQTPARTFCTALVEGEAQTDTDGQTDRYTDTLNYLHTYMCKHVNTGTYLLHGRVRGGVESDALVEGEALVEGGGALDLLLFIYWGSGFK